jgi:hypothetical protein
MDPESTRSRAPSGLFSDDSSSASSDVGRTVSGQHPYRGTRESLLARKNALEKELEAVDSSLEEVAPDVTSPEVRTDFADLSAIFLPRRAIGVVMAGVMTGVCVSSMLAYQLGACWSVGDRGAHVVSLRPARRAHSAPLDESTAERAVRRRKEGEALLMSSLFAASPDPASDVPARITRIGPTTWEVEESVLGSPAPYETVRMVPHFSHEGRVDGIRLFGIRPDGVQSRLGLRNGDVVMRANGIAMTGADGAFAAAESMQRTHYLVLDLQRDGQVIAQHYLIAAR